MAKYKSKTNKKMKSNAFSLKKQNNTTSKNSKNTFTENMVGILSVFGIILTSYLTWVYFKQDKVAFCSQGSGCDIVQQSQWSVFLGLPLSLWGLGLYTLLTWNFFASLPKIKKWKRMWFLSFMGVCISIYLTFIGWFSLGAFCTWCLISFAILTVIFLLINIKKPQNTFSSKSKSSWYLANSLMAFGMISMMFLSGSGIMNQRGDTRLHELAVHLENIDAKFYGAYWCPACAEQKRLFKGAKNKLPYVECSPNGPNTPMTMECSSLGINSYPTWIINGNMHVGVIEPSVLANISGFEWEESINQK